VKKPVRGALVARVCQSGNTDSKIKDSAFDIATAINDLATPDIDLSQVNRPSKEVIYQSKVFICNQKFEKLADEIGSDSVETFRGIIGREKRIVLAGVVFFTKYEV